MAVLKKVTGDSAGQLIDLKGDSTVIGRLQDCHVVLDSTNVSRYHAEIRRQGDGFVLVDLDSRNKTKLNGVELVAKQPHALNPQDRIAICDYEFVYYLNPPKFDTSTRQVDPDVVVLERDEPSLHTLDASRSSALASVVRPEVKLSAILDIARNLSSDLNIDTVSPKILDSLMQLFPQAERGFLVLQEAETKRLVRKAFKYRPNRRAPLASAAQADEVPMSISRSIVNHVQNQKKAVLSQDAGNDSNLPISASIADLKIRSVMCVPLLAPDGQVLGIIQLDTSDRKQFNQDDLDVLAAVAGQAAIAIQNASLHESMLKRDRVDRDMNLARQVQKRFLPQNLPKIPGYEFFAFYNPAYEVGGDYYDFVPLPENRLGIALADVSGKGVAAALMMAKFSGDTRYSILTKPSPAAAAGELNQTLCDAGIDEKFITMSLNVLNVAENRVTLASAGHPPVIVRRADGSIEEVGETISGFPLGIMPGVEYGQTDLDLAVGDVVVVYSDGVTDSRSLDEELYDTRETRRLIKRVADSPGGPEDVGKSILQAIREFSANHSQADDITLICFGRVNPQSSDDLPSKPARATT